MPGIYQGAFGFMGVLSTGGVDTLRKYGYSGYLTYRTDAKYLGGGGSFTINRWLPVVGLSANTYAVPYGDIYIESPSSLGSNIPGIESAGFRYWDRRIRTGVSVGYPLRSNLSAYARWTGTHRGPLHGIPENTYRPFLPTRGFLSQLGGSLRWARGGANTYSISPEGARLVSFSGKLTSSLFGSYVLNSEDSREPFDQVQITAEIREYLDIPWFGNHVLALRAAGGVSFGDRLRYGSFRLGGNYGESSYYVVPDEYISLRGWPIAAASGDWYYLSSAEYRFPIWRVDRGTGTLPLFFRTLHGAVFADAGSAFDDPNQPEGPLLGTGTELRMTGIVGWGLPLQARLGYAFALFPSGGISPNSPASWYFRLGTSF
jgi:outer membrane protein assembly factor BamA